MKVQPSSTGFDAEKLALDNCDQEPIHTPGNIQSFGALLATPYDLSRVDYVSANAMDFLGMEPREILGLPLRDILSRELTHDLRNVLSVSTTATQRERVTRSMVNGIDLEIFVHRNPEGQAVVEFEKAQDGPVQGGLTAIDRMRRLLSFAAQRDDMCNMLKVCVHGLRELTGYDRVKAYRYAPNGDGEVVAEARGSNVESFLGLRYPAWDVPTQARALQVKNPVRMLSDVRQEPVPVLAHGADLPPLDTALSHTRGVSPIHVEYLGNMGVASSLTISLVVGGKLWGMFACHHMSPHRISSDLRIAVEIFGQMISLIIQQREEVIATAGRAKAADARRQILAKTDATVDLLHAFPELAIILMDVVKCDGLAVIRDDTVQHTGSVPSLDAIRAIASRLPKEEDLLEGSPSLTNDGWVNGETLGTSAGCLLIRCTAAYPLQLMFFRDDKVSQVRWAGNPEKTIKTGDHGPRLTPRGSFETYVQERQGHSEDWDTFDLQAGRELQILMTQITAKGERAQMLRHQDMVSHQRQQELMIAELNHRVKNILALIRSLSRQAKTSSASLETYAQALEQRISALAAAHDLAVSDNMSGVSLRGILDTELLPYLGGDNAQVLLSGPLIGLRADVAPMIALVFHELVTNAAKYGALSIPDGMVRAKWSVDDDGLSFSWQEFNGPEVAPTSRHGFGTSLIEKAIPYEFSGTVELDYPPTGATFKCVLPPDTLADLSEESATRVVGKIGEIKKVASGLSGLLLEDNIVLAMDMVDAMTRLGTDTVESVGTVEEALSKIKRMDFDYAILDMNLRGTVSFSVAETLREKDVPFLFVTGYGSGIELPPALQGVTILTKPIDDGSLSHGLERLLKGRT